MKQDEESRKLARPSWIVRHPKWLILGVNLFILVTAELCVRLLAYNGIVRIRMYPTTSPSSSFLGDIDREYGIWHYPNRTVIHRSPCFEVTYSSNSYGARDRERARTSPATRRTVVLGDSFVEGYGVEDAARMTDIAEKLTGAEFLNFGVSGNFGSIQKWLLYRKIAAQFDHTGVAIFLLPANDFEDNDPRHFPRSRYRPYLREGADGGFSVEYTVDFEKREQPRPLPLGRTIRRRFYNNVYLLNLIRQGGELFEESKLKDSLEEIASQRSGISYESFTPLDLRRLLFSYEEIVKVARGKPVSIYIIPTEDDILHYEREPQSFEIVEQLQKFANRFENVHIVDLLPEFVRYMNKHGLEYEDLIHRCDAHWSPLGHRVAAEVLALNVSR